MPLIGSYVDTFSGTLDAGWTANGAAIVGGALAVNCSQAAGAAVYSSARRAGYTLANSAVLFEVAAVPGVVGNQANAQVWVLDPTPANTVDRLGFEYRAAAGELDMLGQTGATYAPIGTTVTVTYSATTMRWLRLRHTGTTIVWETSPDGLTWTVRRTLAQAQVPAWALETDTLTFSVEAFRTTGTNDTFRIDNLNSPPVVTPPAEPEPTGTLQQPVTVVRRNLCPNPALAVDATGWQTRFLGATITVTTSRIATGGAMTRLWAFRGVTTAASTNVVLAAPRSLTAVTVGTVVSGAIDVRFSAVPTAAALIFMWYTADGTWSTYTTLDISPSTITAGAVTRRTTGVGVPANIVYAGVGVRWSSPDPITVDVSAAHVEQIEDTVLPYRDGDSPGWVWTGAAGASPSSITYTIPTTRRNICPNPALAVDASGWSSSGSATPATRAAVTGLDRPWAWQVAQASPGVAFLSSPSVPLTPGARYTMSCQWRFSAIPDGAYATALVSFLDSNGQTLTSAGKPILGEIVPGTPGRTLVVASAPLDAASAYFEIGALTSTAPITVQMTAVRFEAVEDATMPYRDGDSFGWAWDSVSGASTSSTGPDRPRRSPRALSAVSRSYTF